METAYVTSKGQLVVPAKLRRRYGIKPGTKVCFVERDNEILFQPECARHAQERDFGDSGVAQGTSQGQGTRGGQA